MRLCLAPMLFDDEEGPELVAGAKPLGPEKGRLQTQPRRFFRTLLADLGTIVKQRVQPSAAGSPPFDLVSTHSPTGESPRTLERAARSHPVTFYPVACSRIPYYVPVIQCLRR